VPLQGHNTPLPLERSAPGSFKRMLDGALWRGARARRAPREARARLTVESCFWAAATMMVEARRGTSAARPWVVGRGELMLVREHLSSAPRVLAESKELTKGCSWGGSAPPNGSRLSCGRLARQRSVVER